MSLNQLIYYGIVSSSLPSFLPPGLANLEVWFDGADTASITESSGAVSQWNDKSGNANHLLQASAGLKPTTGSNTLNAKNTVFFDGSEMMATTGNVEQSNSQTTFIVAGNIDTTSGSDMHLIKTNGVAAGMKIAIDGTNKDLQLNNGTNLDTGFVLTGFDASLTAKWENTGSAEAQISGLSMATGSTGSGDNTVKMNVGADHTGTAGFFKGDIAEIVHYDRLLSDNEIAQVRTYLEFKWGLRAFTSIWDTTLAGSASDTLVFPLKATGSYDYWVDYGDNSGLLNILVNTSPNASHTYSSGGIKTVKIIGLIEEFRFAGAGDDDKIKEITSWGPLQPGVTSADFFLFGCSALVLDNVDDIINLTGTTSMEGAIRDMALLTTVKGIDAWDISAVVSFHSVFSTDPLFNDPGVSSWVATSGTTFFLMFFNATIFNQPLDFLITSTATNIVQMFQSAVAFDQDLSTWDVTGITTATNFLLGVTMSTANYDALLIGWEAQAVNNSVTFHGGGSKFSAGAAATARAALISDHSWTITDGGAA